MLVSIVVVGILAGFLGGKIMSGAGYGNLMDLLLGLVGGIVGSIVLGLVGMSATGIIGRIIVSTLGAVILIWITRWVRSRRGTTP